MRFRATIDNVPTFLRVAQAIEKLQKQYIITLTPSQMKIICNDDTNDGGIQVWSVIKVDSIFSDYRIMSNSKNEITMRLSADALISVLRSGSLSSGGLASSGQSSQESAEEEVVVVKLAKKGDEPVLSFEFNLSSRVGEKHRVTHDVKIELLKKTEVERLSEPMCPEPDVHVLLPSLQKIRTIVDRLKPMSNILAIKANNNKHLQLSIRTDNVNCETLWTNCANPNMRQHEEHEELEEPEEEVDPNKMFTVTVPIKGFLKFLNSHVVSTNTIACICHRHCLILYVYIGALNDAGGVLTYYIPTIIDE
ncbi:checkpoint protein Hus1/Mec3 [Pterulicium gracile]|uniref:Checkpoint protein n=1 Tax=Pterulicium gracile TaxID=1884261 RepID=A0A5C3QY88_9AGAR|nr:checkpoint protein Hus1/Mec3 [Pterula gracilis]